MMLQLQTVSNINLPNIHHIFQFFKVTNLTSEFDHKSLKFSSLQTTYTPECSVMSVTKVNTYLKV